MGLWDVDKIEYVGRQKGPQEGWPSITTTPIASSPARR